MIRNILQLFFSQEVDPSSISIIKERSGKGVKVFEILKSGDPHERVDVAFIATITLTLSVLLVLFQYPAGSSVDRFGRFFGLIMGEVTGIVWIILTLISIELHQAEVLILAYAMLGISIAFWRPSVVLSFIEIDPSAVSSNYGVLSFIQRLGTIPTAAIAGVLFPLIGFSPLLIMTFIGTLIVIVIFIKIDRLEKNHLSENATKPAVS